MKKTISAFWILSMFTCATQAGTLIHQLDLPAGTIVSVKAISEVEVVQGRDDVSILVKPTQATLPNQALISLPDYCIASGKVKLAQKKLTINLDRFFCINPDQKVFDIKLEALGSFEENAVVGVECVDASCKAAKLREGVKLSVQLQSEVNSNARRVYE